MNTSFERSKDGKDEWLTPPEIIRVLGQFDLDPCAPIKRPWDTAANHFTREDDGLSQPWNGRIWMNPPYGTQTARWLKRLTAQGNGIALTFARTETRMFFDTIWNKADAILFIQGRLKFYNVDGTVGKNSAGAASCLIAYGANNALALKNSGIKGRFINLK
jgi:hypothetical protein